MSLDKLDLLRSPDRPDLHIRDLGAEFVRREVAPYLQEWEDAGSIPRELHLAAGKQGLPDRDAEWL